MTKLLQFANDVIRFNHQRDVVVFTQHVQIQKLEIIGTEQFMVNLDFQLLAHRVFLLESIYVLDFSLLDK